MRAAKMGRPPLPLEKKRGASMGFRPTPTLREKLEGQAAVNQRSVSQEIEYRLQQSFDVEDIVQWAERRFTARETR